MYGIKEYFIFISANESYLKLNSNGQHSFPKWLTNLGVV